MWRELTPCRSPTKSAIVPTANATPGHYIFVYVTTGLQSTTSVPFAQHHLRDLLLRKQRCRHNDSNGGSERGAVAIRN